MKLASKEAIGLMLDGEVLYKEELNIKAWYSDAEGFRYQYSDCKPEAVNTAWQSEGWELQKKYTPLPIEWKNKWAMYRAVDSDGRLYEYPKKPLIGSGVWSYAEMHYLISDGHDPTNWENSLEERLTRSSEPTTSGDMKIIERLTRIENHLGLQ